MHYLRIDATQTTIYKLMWFFQISVWKTKQPKLTIKKIKINIETSEYKLLLPQNEYILSATDWTNNGEHEIG